MFSRKRRYYWPQKRKYPSAIEWIKKHHSKLPRIDKRTAISSIGSCFAREIKNYLISKDFNYLLGSEYENYFHSEKFFPGDKGASPSSHASVAWERVYNTFTLRNIIDYSQN